MTRSRRPPWQIWHYCHACGRMTTHDFVPGHTLTSGAYLYQCSCKRDVAQTISDPWSETETARRIRALVDVETPTPRRKSGPKPGAIINPEGLSPAALAAVGLCCGKMPWCSGKVKLSENAP